MGTKTLQVAVIRNPKFGVGDRGQVILTFDTYTSPNTAALQVLSVDQAVKMLLEGDIGDINDLEGKTCYVETDSNMMIFKEIWPPHNH